MPVLLSIAENGSLAKDCEFGNLARRTVQRLWIMMEHTARGSAHTHAAYMRQPPTDAAEVTVSSIFSADVDEKEDKEREQFGSQHGFWMELSPACHWSGRPNRSPRRGTNQSRILLCFTPRYQDGTTP